MVMADEQQETLFETSEQEAPREPQRAEGPTSEEYQELNNRYLRLAADFENFRKRQAQEREYLFKYGAQTTLENLLPVLDNLERAKQSLSVSSDPAMLYKSFELLSDQLLESLKTIGLEKMSPKGETFDPERHEAVSQMETQDAPDMTVLDVYKDGYLYHDRVIRPAQVVVARAPEESAAEEGSSGKAFHTNEPTFDPAKSEKKPNPFQQAQPE